MTKNLPSVKVNTNMLKKAGKKAKLPIGVIAQAADIIPAIFDAYKQTLDTKVEITKIQAQRDVLIEDIKQRYSLYSQIFQGIFSERSQAIQKFFDVIDLGIKNNDDTLISQGMQQLSNVVTSSPFVAFSDFKKQLESGEPFELWKTTKYQILHSKC